MISFRHLPQFDREDICSSRICRMEIGLWKMKKRQSIVARPSPALGVVLWVVFGNASVQIDVIVYNSLTYSFFCL